MHTTPWARLSGHRATGAAALTVLAVVLLAAPLVLPDFWQQLILFSGAAAVGAIGLNLLVGVNGQLSLAHGFFLAVGAYGYAYLGPGTGDAGTGSVGLPTPVAALLAVAAAGVAGLLFSPVAARVRGIYLGLASLALIIVCKQVLAGARTLTGGAYGRDIPEFDLLGFHFGDQSPYLYVLGKPFGAFDRLWYLVMVVLVLAYVFMRNVLRSRVGRGLRTIRDSEAAAAAAGVHVQRYKSLAFTLSSVYAGIAGVLLGLLFQHVVPEYFSLTLSVQYLAMIVIGGMGSARGAVAGAFVVTGIPLLLAEYSEHIPFTSTAGDGGLDTGVLSQFVFGALIIVILIAGARRPGPLLRSRRAKSGDPAASAVPTPASGPTERIRA
ncbi:branched-chain amino acid ABC transporter permease [Actinomadura physcomitrii]|uniref:branched-chain amino acid ABC transporter permease n=1 Tax=Actinomadura physcomitrii TaxID=2650748 RepID=UPI0019234BAF|nr:branched-chain amino acid ABC transporter permease [Actinomadura physcomitrii]